MAILHPAIQQSRPSQADNRESPHPGQDPVVVHQRLLSLAARKHAYDVEEGEWLILGQSMRVHDMFGYSSFTEYLERVFGYTPKVAVERLRVARALAELPKTRAAVSEGAISWSTARELTRVVNTETEERWLAAAKGKTVREVERMVAFRKPGDDPDSPPSPVPERRVARFDLGADAWALLQEARARVARDLGHHVTDDELIRTMARAVLDGPNDEGRSSYSIHVTKCDACGVASQRAGGEDVIVGPEVVEMAECDAVILPSDPPQGDDPRGDDPRGGPARRATQTIPPATRRSVMLRHRGRCAVPGCRNHQFVDIHHTRRRSEGGNHDPRWLIVLCGAHHAAEHEGRLIIAGDAEAGFRFSHADGTCYGRNADPDESRAFATAFLVLVRLGYKEGQARRGIEGVRPHVGPDADTDTIIRAALAWLREQASQARDGTAGWYGRTIDDGTGSCVDGVVHWAA